MLRLPPWPTNREAPNKPENLVSLATFPDDIFQRHHNIVECIKACHTLDKVCKHLAGAALCRKFGSEFSIVQLIYCSHATMDENKVGFERDLFDILDRSHVYNPSHDITGALLTDGRMFAHVVEGPSTAVEELYAKIMRDKRHNRVLTLQHVLVHVRLFALWPAAGVVRLMGGGCR